MAVLLLFISILPVFILGYYIYNSDKNKEPLKLIAKFFLFGIISGVFVIIFSLLLELFIPSINVDIDAGNIDYLTLFVHTFIIIAFVEELSKWFFTYRIGYNNKEFDELYDMIVYSVFTSLGFALLENIFYVFIDGGIAVGISRGLLSIPGHTCFGIFMGYYLSMAKYRALHNEYRLEKLNKVKSIVIPTVLHGVYDYCCFAGSYFVIIFFVFIIFLYFMAYKKMRYTLSIVSKVKYNNNYCSSCGTKIVGEYCIGCGAKQE
ncbi:MAG: PrsW family intramembrane metalloprotease [Firmicutes bacterium]|nr:PrsW family intramembrane metalloprotease [Bacillota bacterium]